MLFRSFRRAAAACFSGVLAFSLVAPTFVSEASAAPLPVATTLSLQGAGLPLTEVRYRGHGNYGHYRHYGRYGRRGFGGGALVLGVLGLGIASIAAQERADRRREREQYYYGGGYYNQGYAPAPVYAPEPVYTPEPVYADPAPVYVERPQIYVQPGPYYARRPAYNRPQVFARPQVYARPQAYARPLPQQAFYGHPHHPNGRPGPYRQGYNFH